MLSAKLIMILVVTRQGRDDSPEGNERKIGSRGDCYGNNAAGKNCVTLSLSPHFGQQRSASSPWVRRGR